MGCPRTFLRDTLTRALCGSVKSGAIVPGGSGLTCSSMSAWYIDATLLALSNPPVLAAEQKLAPGKNTSALSRHPAQIRVLVPHYAMRVPSLIALAAGQIILDPNGVLGSVDPQLGEYPAASVLSVLDARALPGIEDK